MRIVMPESIPAAARLIESLPPVVFASDPKEREMIAKGVVLRVLRGGEGRGVGDSAATYTVRWARASEPETLLECHGLDPRTVVARLIGAIRNSGAMIVHAVEREAGPQEALDEG